MNAALVLLDSVGQLSLQSVETTIPPASASDGDCYGVPVGAVNDWAGREGEIAVFSNGGWLFVVPQRGWKAWISDKSAGGLFDGAYWVAGAVALSVNSAATLHEVLEIEHVISAGATDAAVAAIPAMSMVLGVTGRVTTAITGALTTWRLGVAGSDNRYGGNLGLSQGSWVRGQTSAPLTYYSDTDLLLTGEGGDFAAGNVRLVVHLMRLTIPTL